MTTPFPIGLLVALLHINTHVAEGISNKPESCIYFPKSALTTLIDLNRGLLGSDLTLLFYDGFTGSIELYCFNVLHEALFTLFL